MNILREKFLNFGNEISQLLDRFNGRVNQLETDVASLQAEVQSLRQLADRQEEKSTRLSNEMTLLRNDLVPIELMVHNDIARRLDALINGDYYHVATLAASDQHDQAVAMSCLTEVLFDPGLRRRETRDLHDELLGRGVDVHYEEMLKLRAQTESLLQAAEATGHGHSWTWTGERGKPIADGQQSWEGSTEGGLVTLIIAPGYVVGDKTYAPQRVLVEVPKTAPADAPRPASPVHSDDTECESAGGSGHAG